MLKKKNTVYIVCTCFMALALTGCGNTIPELTEEQNALVTEYAAGLLLKYHADYQGRLVDTSVVPEEEVAPPTVEEEVPEENVQISANSASETDALSDNSTVSARPETSPQLSASQVLDMTDFDISYTGYEVCDSYPNQQTSSEDLFFAMQAGEGNKLVVLKLQVANTGEQTLAVNTLGLSELKCRVIVNGKKHNALVTMLDNDFMMLEQAIEPGASIETVVVTEISAEEAEQIQAVELYIQNGEKDITIQ